ncbi:deoxynucleoside kinase [Fervidibacillus halotolerans]|uniref:Deoxynucleoside kinase n=1 Tax=Fervidibacillus halotolerans TaxID=2980027 RepID=A0A9E8LYZ4_9BACI|nr:deoxynucleoside kinase [Fervidibacillus halotolerans]WAA12310.1 deoxynucleoside kinase [Fervidibacillus halotolerans]
MNPNFIAVEGPIGAGKTSLAKALSNHFHFYLLKEIVEENPYLGKFYENIDEWAFQTEMFFLTHRFKQLEDIQNHFLQWNKPVVSDFHMFKNLIFAQLTLRSDYYEKYAKIYSILTEGLPEPNMVIYIHANVDTLLKRIALRGRNFEKSISPDYLKQLSEKYEIFIEQFERDHPNVPILRIDGNATDFVNNIEDLHSIINDVTFILAKGANNR